MQQGWLSIAIITLSYILLLATSGKVVGGLLKLVLHKNLESAAASDEGNVVDKVEQKRRIDVGMLIGKCENVLILSFLILEAYTALALVVTAKTFVRKEEIEKNSMFFLAGTMLNVSYSVLIGMILKIVLTNIAH